MQIAAYAVRDAAEIERAIQEFTREPNGGLIVLPPRPADANRATILRLAAQHQLPTVYQDRALAAEGGGHASLPVYPRLQLGHVRCGAALPLITAATGNSL